MTEEQLRALSRAVAEALGTDEAWIGGKCERGHSGTSTAVRPGGLCEWCLDEDVESMCYHGDEPKPFAEEPGRILSVVQQLAEQRGHDIVFVHNHRGWLGSIGGADTAERRPTLAEAACDAVLLAVERWGR